MTPPAPATLADGTAARRGVEWRLVVALTIVAMLSMFDKYSLSLLIQPIKASLSLSDGQMGIAVSGAFKIANIAASIPAGWAADGAGRRRIVAIGIVIWSLAAAACGVATGFWQFVVARAGVGFGEGLIPPASYSLIRDGVAPERRARAFGIYAGSNTFGPGLALVFGGLIIAAIASLRLDHLPLVEPVRPWQLTLILSGCIGLPLALLAFGFPEPGRDVATVLFVNVSTGFKAGGLYLGLPPNSYRPEHLTAYQIGSKNRFFDNKLQLNLEGFYWDYKDQQIYTFANVNPAGFANYPINEDGYVKGVEGELVVLPTRNDRFSLDVVYEDGKFTNYYNPGATLFVPPATVITVVPQSTLENVDRPALPNWNGSASYAHTFRLASSATVVFDAGVHFESGAYFDLTQRPNSYRDAYAMGDLKLTYNAPGGRWSVGAFVDNVTNNAVLYGGSVLTYAKSTAYTPPNPNAWTVSIYPPRTFGGRVNVSF